MRDDSRAPSTYWLDPDNRIVRVNDAFGSFARENGAEDLAFLVVGRPLESFIVGAHLAQLITDVFGAARRRDWPVELAYRCDSPLARRVFDLRVTPHRDGTLECASWLREEVRRAVAVPVTGRAPDSFTIESGDYLTMCSWCKRARTGGRWEEMDVLASRERLLERDPFPPISHGLCEECEHKLADAGSADSG